MSSIAYLLLQRAVNITGSDLEKGENVVVLQKSGAEIFIGHSGYIPGSPDLVVYSAAVPVENEDRQKASELNIKQIKRGDFLAELATYYPKVIAVAGSHGKTTVTAMLAHIFRFCGCAADFVIGGKPAGSLPSASSGKGEYFITEADESDLSMAEIKPYVSVVVNVEDDHSWNVGGKEALFAGFKKFAFSAPHLIYGSGEIADDLFKGHSAAQSLDYSIDQLEVPQAGRHNRFNAAVSAKVAETCGLPAAKVAEALKVFQGVNRRCTTHAQGQKHIVIEDYAHHPTELRAFIDTLKEDYQGYKTVILFQPHRYERVEMYCDEFTSILKECDNVFITPPFAAWNLEKCHETKDLAARSEGIYFDSNDWEYIATEVVNYCPPSEKTIYAVIGAATVNKVIPYLRNIIRMNEILMINPDLELHTDLSWADLTTLSIGSNNPLVALPANIAELQALLSYLHVNQIVALPLGCGSNMVGGDEAYDGVIIRLRNGRFSDVDIDGEDVVSGAGVRLNRFVTKLAEAGLGGEEALIAIPGSVGGAVRMNAGAHGVEIGDFVTRVEGVRLNGELWQAEGGSIEWHYRGSDIPIDVIITKVYFTFQLSEKSSALERINDTRDFRKKTQPGGKSPGCAFRNPGNDSAGRLIDKYGMKDFSSGDCAVSDVHANFIVNQGQGTEADFANLLEKVQLEIYKNCGVILRNEVVFSTNRIINTVKSLSIAVLKGGISAEREISLTSGTAVAQALRDGGHVVRELDVTENSLPKDLGDVDLVFPVLHGVFGEDGQVQNLLDKADYKYVGTGAAASAITIDKYDTVNLLRTNNIDVAASQVLGSPDQSLAPILKYPVIVKPNSQGSTIGMSIVNSVDELQEAVKKAFAVDEKVLIEEFIKGKETTVGLLFGDSLPVVEIIPPDGFFDYDAKYTYSKGETIYNCPPHTISEAVQIRMQKIAERCYAVTNARDLLRVDMIWQEDTDRIVVLEVNTMPGFTASSLLPKSAAQNNMSFTELCCKIAVTAYQR
jgi:UDP-N-acetylenolpyruvoylglucosamine reductase